MLLNYIVLIYLQKPVAIIKGNDPMKQMVCASVAIIIAALTCCAQEQVQSVDQAVTRQSDQAWDMAKHIWEWAEPGYQEHRSAKLLADTLERAGFKVQRGVAKIPTAFTATVGSGKPVIVIMGEYDALPGLANEAVPFRKPKEGSGWGHGCGHHLFGVASATACIAIGEQIKAGKLKGTLRFYGCPAEEGGAARAFMVRAGLFKDVDIALHWHPSSRNSVSTSSNLARIGVQFRFHGKSAHAAGSPERGRSALDAVELTNHAAQLLREHCPDYTRIHHVITYGGGAPNVVPAFAEVYYYVRHPDAEVVRSVYERLLKCAQAGALATETKLEVNYLGGTVQMIPNSPLADLAFKHLKTLNDLKYDAEEMKFALRLQETFDEKASLDSIEKVVQSTQSVNTGSTDVSDVSWVVPTGGFSTACWVPGTPGHSWQAAACGGTSIGKKGMMLAARVLAAMAVELFENPQLIEEAKADHQRRLGGRTYNSLLLPDQDPPLDYRNPPKGR